jgi:tetratricopeptide (TPR) repeat protein
LRDAATSAYKRGLYKEALSLYTKCLATDCDEKDAVLANRAACWLMVDQAERAVDDCRKASSVIAEQLPKADADERSRLVSQRSKVAARLSSSLQRLGRVDEALAVVEDDPSLTEKRNQLEQCQSTQRSAAEAYAGEEYSRAKRCFVKLRDDYNVTDDADARVKLASCHVRTRRPHAVDATRSDRVEPPSRLDTARNRKRDHPLHQKMETTRVDVLKPPRHRVSHAGPPQGVRRW